MDAPEIQIYKAVILAVIVVGTAVVYFFYSVFQHHKKVLRLERERAEAQVNLLEKDRARIAADLHDDLAPMLVAVKMRINSFDLNGAGDQHQLVRTNETIDDMARRMRAISFDLMPSTLQEKGLETAIAEFVNAISTDNKLKIKFIPSDRKVILDEQKTVHTYRILHEIIHNTVKHAHASELVIVLKNEKNYLVITSKDNGVGFDYKQKLKRNNGLGLKSLLNRIHLLHANYHLESGPEKGTKITIQIPLQNDNVFKDKGINS